MTDVSTIVVFAAAVMVLVYTPGPNTIYIIACSVDQGRKAGIISALGVEVGTLVHVVFAALGISALLMSSATAFSIVKYAGAAYLIYLGIKTLLSKEKPQTEEPDEMSLGRTFSQAVVVNVLNPKTAMFFLAFLPQFVDIERGSIATQVLFLGSIVVVIGFTSGSFYSLVAAGIGRLMRGNIKFLRGQRYFAGSIYIGLGAAAALTGTHRK